MEDLTFYDPTLIEFGTDKEQSIGRHLAVHGVRSVLLCYGSQRIKRDGLFAIVGQRLAEQGIKAFELGGIVSNPVISKVREGIALARAQHVDAVLAVGGGGARQRQVDRRWRVLRGRCLGPVRRQGPRRVRGRGDDRSAQRAIAKTRASRQPAVAPTPCSDSGSGRQWQIRGAFPDSP